MKLMMRRQASRVVLAVVLVAIAPAVRAVDSGGAADPLRSFPEAGQPRIGDPISEAELQDLQAIASQTGMSLEAAIDRYAWNDNFALAVSMLREAFPDAVSGAEIVNGRSAWIAFAAGAPGEAIETLETFTANHPSVEVDIRVDFGFNEVELQEAIAIVHYAVIEAPGVADASTSFDFGTRQISCVVALDSGAADSIADLRAHALGELARAGLGGILDAVEIAVVRSPYPVLGGADDR